ncbi:23485_t:CDS:2 [Dentiscutata erythropus]|uniref:23485_t:CDS:1 n=1 Tax=Dentiscutata erythropus TaxID=1348616 RepID=A0A9N8WL25_9GLOM|nr:23485_t:CDS:2 [Dentiscutata erythropus]
MSFEEKDSLDKIKDQIQLYDSEYYITQCEWTLISFLRYRQKCTDFTYNKAEEHDRYTYSLTKILSWKEVPTNLLAQSIKALESFQVSTVTCSLDGVAACVQSPSTPDGSWEVFKLRLGVVSSYGVAACVQSPSTPDGSWEMFGEKRSPIVTEFWESFTMQKRKYTAISERTTVLEHATAVLKITSQQDQLIREGFTSTLENKIGDGSSKKRLCTTEKEKETVAQETDVVIVQEETLNSVIEASNIFRDVQFPEYYSKLKTIWQTHESSAGYYVIDLGNKEILKQTHDLLNEDELKLLSYRMALVDENKSLSEKALQYLKLFDKIVPYSDNEEEEETDFNIDDEMVLKIEKDIQNLNGLTTKFKHLSYTLPILIKEYDESIYPEIHIISSISRHLSAISKMDRIFINTTERTWTAHVLSYLFFMTFSYISSIKYYSCERQISTKFDLQNVDYRADGVAELFERPKQIPVFILEVSGDPDNPDLDKYNDDRKKLMKEGIFALNKFITGTKFPTWETCESLGVFLAQGFENNLELGQMIFIGPGLYLFSPFTVPNLTIPTSPFELEHAPRLIRTLLCLRFNIIRKIKKYQKLEKKGQHHIINPSSKYSTGFTPGRPEIVTFDKFLSKVPDDKTNSEQTKEATKGKVRGRGRGRGVYS